MSEYIVSDTEPSVMSALIPSVPEEEPDDILEAPMPPALRDALASSAPPQPSPPGPQTLLTPYSVTIHAIAPNGFPVTFALEAASLAEGSAALMKLVFDMVSQGFSVPDHVPF